MNSISSLHSGGLGFSISEIIAKEICFHSALMLLAELGRAQICCSAVRQFWTCFRQPSEPVVTPS